LGGWVIQNHGVRTWWHVQRALLAAGLCREIERRPVTTGEAAAFSGVTARFYRDLAVFHRVWPGDDPCAMYERLRVLRQGSVEDRVMLAPMVGAVL
jgi:hypothetical protein